MESTAPRATTFSDGDLVCARFRVVRFIARGGMGEVYEAEDLELSERVAIKTIREDIAADERVNQRFRREVQLARKITHPNICRIFDLFQHQFAGPREGTPPVLFVTMELLTGETLAQRLKRDGPMTVEQARPIVAQMAAALSAAHAADIVHRDFKSSNVVLLPPARDWDAPRAVVTDFGLAYSVSDSTKGVSLSGSGDLLGTPDYMAPEQVEGAAVTPATDVYALGIVLYEMVTGVRPFVGDTPIASALRRVAGPPARPPRELAPNLPPAWDAAIMTCLARLPSRRFPDASFVLQALEPGSVSLRRPLEIPRRLVAAALLVLVVAGGVVAWRVWNLSTAPASVDGTPNPDAGPVTGSASRPAIAVLGFRNLANRTDAEWLSTALSEMVTTELGAGEAVRTVPGENVDRMKVELMLADSDAYSPETLTRIRGNLGSDLVAFGSYVTVGDGEDASLRVDIRLQDSRDGQMLSVVSESGRAAELLDLVARAGVRLRQGLGVKGDAVPAVLESVRASQPASSEAMRLYAEGLARLRRFDALGARGPLERAVQADAKFPLAHAALARTWSTLGYDARAREAARRAFELSSGLTRADRLLVEGTYHEMNSAWSEAIEIWKALANFFPDDIEHALRLARAQVASGAAREGLAAIERFRSSYPAIKDPRLELAEAGAQETLSDFKKMEAAAGAAAAAAERQGATLVVAAARLRQGAAELLQGRAEAATRLFENAKALYEAAGDRGGVARALNNLASATSDGDKRTDALYEEGLAIARAIGEQAQVARFLSNMAIQQRRAGNLQASLRMNQESLAIRREIGDKATAAVSLNNIGNVLLDMGDLASASQHYEQSVAASREIGDRRGLARALYNQAEALRLKGDLARARATGREALDIRRGIDDPASVATSLFGVGATAALEGDLATGARLLTEGLEMDRKLNRRRPMAYGLYFLGEVALMQGDIALARRRHQEALDMRTALGEKGTAAESRAALARLALEEGQPSAAEALAREAIAVFEDQMANDNEATSRGVLALALAGQGRQPAAAREASRARALVKDSQNALARLPVAVAAAQVEAASAPRDAVRALEAARREAEQLGIPRAAFEARRALADVERRASPGSSAGTLASLRKDAAARGFTLFAK